MVGLCPSTLTYCLVAKQIPVSAPCRHCAWSIFASYFRCVACHSAIRPNLPPTNVAPPHRATSASLPNTHTDPQGCNCSLRLEALGTEMVSSSPPQGKRARTPPFAQRFLTSVWILCQSFVLYRIPPPFSHPSPLTTATRTLHTPHPATPYIYMYVYIYI